MSLLKAKYYIIPSKGEKNLYHIVGVFPFCSSEELGTIRIDFHEKKVTVSMQGIFFQTPLVLREQITMFMMAKIKRAGFSYKEFKFIFN